MLSQSQGFGDVEAPLSSEASTIAAEDVAPPAERRVPLRESTAPCMSATEVPTRTDMDHWAKFYREYFAQVRAEHGLSFQRRPLLIDSLLTGMCAEAMTAEATISHQPFGVNDKFI